MAEDNSSGPANGLNAHMWFHPPRASTAPPAAHFAQATASLGRTDWGSIDADYPQRAASVSALATPLVRIVRPPSVIGAPPL